MSAPEGYALLGIVGFSPKGPYNAAETYDRFDAVYYEGSTFYAIHDGLTGVTPVVGNDWALMCQGTASDMTSSVKGIGRPDNVSALVSSGVFSVNGAVIPSYVRTGATEYESEWLSAEAEGEALIPDEKQIYRIVGASANERLYVWDGTSYKPWEHVASDLVYPDGTTSGLYKLGVDNGLLYIEEV